MIGAVPVAILDMICLLALNVSCAVTPPSPLIPRPRIGVPAASTLKRIASLPAGTPVQT